jgi:hypothetical protein
MDKKFTIKSGGRVIIEINFSREVQSSKSKVQSPKGLIGARREEDYLARRTQDGYINFYDLGQYLVDDYWETQGAFFQQILSRGEYETVVNDPNEAGMLDALDELNAAILDVPLENFETNFFKILKGLTEFERTIKVKFPREGDPDYEDDLRNVEEWTEKGLKLDSDQAADLIIKPQGALYGTNDLTFENHKFTSVPDYEADEVEFLPTPKMDIFLMPVMIVPSSYTVYANGLMFGVTFNGERIVNDALGYSGEVMPRELLNEYWEIDFDNDSDYVIDYKVSMLAKQFYHPQGARAKRELSEGDPTNYVYSFETVDPATLPFPTIYQPSAPVNDTHVYNIAFISGFAFITFEGGDRTRLKAIIKKGGNWYYAWNTD